MSPLGNSRGPACAARCGWKLDPALADAGYDRHPTCVPDGQPWLPKQAVAQLELEEAEAREAIDARNLAELERLVGATRTARQIANDDIWPGRFPPRPQPQPQAEAEAAL